MMSIICYVRSMEQTIVSRLLEDLTDDLVTVKEAARLLGISRQTCYAYIRRGQLHPLRIGDRSYISRREIESLRPK